MGVLFGGRFVLLFRLSAPSDASGRSFWRRFRHTEGCGRGSAAFRRPPFPLEIYRRPFSRAPGPFNLPRFLASASPFLFGADGASARERGRPICPISEMSAGPALSAPTPPIWARRRSGRASGRPMGGGAAISAAASQSWGITPWAATTVPPRRPNACPKRPLRICLLEASAPEGDTARLFRRPPPPSPERCIPRYCARVAAPVSSTGADRGRDA